MRSRGKDTQKKGCLLRFFGGFLREGRQERTECPGRKGRRIKDPAADREGTGEEG